MSSPGFAVGHFDAGVVDDHDLVLVAHRGAGAFEQQLVRIVEPRHVDQSLGRSVDFLRRAAELLAEPAPQLGR